jgi:hypothetical protein
LFGSLVYLFVCFFVCFFVCCVPVCSSPVSASVASSSAFSPCSHKSWLTVVVLHRRARALSPSRPSHTPTAPHPPLSSLPSPQLPPPPPLPCPHPPSPRLRRMHPRSKQFASSFQRSTMLWRVFSEMRRIGSKRAFNVAHSPVVSSLQ